MPNWKSIGDASAFLETADPEVEYAKNRRWSDLMLPTIRVIAGRYVLEPAPEYQDTREATDLMVLTARDMRIGARVRRSYHRNLTDRNGNYVRRYEFTMRSHTANGNPSEVSKVFHGGWADWLFYGFAVDNTEPAIDPWWIVNLDVLRRLITVSPSYEVHPVDEEIWVSTGGGHSRGGIPGIPNTDGSGFWGFQLSCFKRYPEVLVAKSW